MMQKKFTFSHFYSGIFLVLLLISACEREPAVINPADADHSESLFQSNVVRLDTLIFTNLVRTNGQARFDLIGNAPAIKTGDIVYYPGGSGLYGKVLAVTVVGSRMVFQLEKASLDKVFTNLSIQNTISTGLLKSRTRTDAHSWNSDTLGLEGVFLYNNLWQTKSLQVQLTAGKLFSKSSGGQFNFTGQGADPWFDRVRLDFNYALVFSGDLTVKAGGALDASDSLMVERSVYGPFLVNGFPVSYQLDTWLGFHAVTEKDTVLTLSLTGISSGSLNMTYNYWETWKILQNNQAQSATVKSFKGPRLSGYQCEIFVSQVITPYFCGESSMTLSNRFQGRIHSDAAAPDWQADQTISNRGILTRSGVVFGTVVPGQLTTTETLLYSEAQTGLLENQPPKAAFEIKPSTGFTDTNFEFDASTCTDLETPVGSLMVRWDFDGDNHYDTEFSTNKLAFKKYSQPGVYMPVMEVKDAGGLTSRMTTSVDVGLSSSAPVAYFTVTPESGRISDIFIFDAYGCYDSEDPISLLKVRWDFDGDGTWDTNWSTRKTEYYIFRGEGRYVAKLEVLDTQELTGSTTRIITVARTNIKPTAFFTVEPDSGTTETKFNFDASGSSDPEDSTKFLEVRWDWENDGTFDTGYRTVKTIQHTFPAAGTYSVVMEVIDTEGYGATYSRDIVVTNPNTPPDADFTVTPSPGRAGAEITFDASLSVDAEDSPDKLEVRWDWDNDNIYDTEFTTQKIYKRAFYESGSYIIKVQVRDSGGLMDTRVRLLVIE